VGRYDDSFEVRAFGDNMGRWGTPSVLIETGPYPSPEPDEPLLRLNFVALVSALEAVASGSVEQADLERYESIPMNDSSGMLHVIIRGARVFGEAGDAFTADIGVAANQGVSTRSGSPRAIVTGVIAELGDLRVFSPMEAVDGNGLTTVPLPSHAVKEGDTVDLPPRSQCVLQVGQPVELMLLRPGAPGGRYRVERILATSAERVYARRMALTDDFQKAQERVKTLTTRPSNDTLLELYSLFKQATEGDVQGKRPGMLDLKGRAKYDAWAGRKGLGKDAAMQQYLQLVDRLLKGG
jgi:acyl-CoA-binding protein